MKYCCSFSIFSCIDCVCGANEQFVKFFKPILPELAFQKLNLAFHEAVVNAIYHGNDLCEKKQVNIIFEADKEEVRITVEDAGRGFTPQYINTLASILQHEGKMGLVLIRQMVDEVKVTRHPSQVTLTINL